MAEIIINIDEEEQKEFEELREFIESLTKEQRFELWGFLKGLRFAA